MGALPSSSSHSSSSAAAACLPVGSVCLPGLPAVCFSCSGALKPSAATPTKRGQAGRAQNMLLLFTARWLQGLCCKAQMQRHCASCALGTKTKHAALQQHQRYVQQCAATGSRNCHHGQGGGRSRCHNPFSRCHKSIADSIQRWSTRSTIKMFQGVLPASPLRTDHPVGSADRPCNTTSLKLQHNAADWAMVPQLLEFGRPPAHPPTHLGGGWMSGRQGVPECRGWGCRGS
jgi:hypothetical protein